MLKIKLYQCQVGVGAACALLLGVQRNGAPSSKDTPMLAAVEALSFGLCCLGTIVGGRAIRARFEALGSDQSVARADPDYMRNRREVQFTAMVATVAVASLVASRSGLNPLYVALLTVAAMVIAILITNRMAGWKAKS